ncbi:MAG TPA: SIS domain-containing protein [Ktedonobacteraceae bacterium]|jgi:glucosamine--fructose-6-phosphate aminotransferase (isomerizing)|nr:SIS domain-containing protein [Ktedonobacteraceae bacterium]
MANTATHLYRSIHAQPQAIRDLLADRAMIDTLAQQLVPCQRILLVGTGTSFHAATIGAHLFRSLGLEAWAIAAFEFVNYPTPLHANDGVLIISHRGNKQYSMLAAQRAQEVGAVVISISGKDPKEPVTTPWALTTVDQDPSSAHTISYTATLTRLGQIIVRLIQLKGFGDLVQQLEQGLALIPAAMEDALQREQAIREVAQDAVAKQRRIYYIGAGPNATTAKEGALKAKETAYVTAEGFELEQAIHGPLVAVEKNDLVVVIAPAEASARERTASLLQALHEIGSAVWLIGNMPTVEVQPLFQQDGWHHFPLAHADELPEAINPLLTVLPLQLFADFASSTRGTDADGFRLNEPAYKQAMAHIHL